MIKTRTAEKTGQQAGKGGKMKMKIQQSYSITCEECTETEHTQWATSESHAETIFKAAGWRGNVCPDCMKCH
jgi:hypothetical protein